MEFILTVSSYFIVTHLAGDETEVIRYAALLRGTESAWQAVSYGLTSIKIFAEAGAIYMNFSLWAIAILPVWLVIRHFGGEKDQSREAIEEVEVSGEAKLDSAQ